MPIKQENWTKNYLYKHKLLVIKENARRLDPETGLPSIIKFIDIGGTRSSKTFDNIQLILTYLSEFSNHKSLHVDVYRKTMVLSRDNSFKDFLDCFEILGLVKKSPVNNKNFDFEAVGDSGSVAPTIRIWGHTIDFKGMPIPTLAGKVETGQADIVYVNEIAENDNKDIITKLKQRCYMLFIADCNPSATVHWAYDFKEFNTFYTHTTYLDNVHLPSLKRADYEAWCPWDFDDSEIVIEDPFGVGDGFKRRRWLKPERPDDITAEMDVEGLYRRDNRLNIERGTADKAQWLIYGEGVAYGRNGQIYKDVTWVDSFPDVVDNCYFGLDYGFTHDKSSLVRCGNIGRSMYVEKLCYQCTPTSDSLFNLVEKPLLAEERRRYIEANDLSWYDKLCELRRSRIDCYLRVYSTIDEKEAAIDLADELLQDHLDSGLQIEPIMVVTDTQDTYKGRGGSDEQQFNIDLNLKAQQYGYSWSFVKVGSKPIVPGIALVNKFDLCFVKDKDLLVEQQNYVYGNDNAGNSTNIPDVACRMKHALDAMRYCIWKFFKYVV
jgi:hypothetical protein